MQKKLLSLLLVLCMLLGMFPMALPVSAEETTETAAVEDTNVISVDSADDITDMSGNYKLIADITVTAPIGTTAAPFKGTFDGDGHTVTVNISASAAGAGLFGVVGPGATIKNLTVDGSITSSANNVGGIIGHMTVSDDTGAITVENCKNYATVKGKASIGGIVGRFEVVRTSTYESKIVNCANYGAISDTTGGMVGGIVGIASSGNNSGSNGTLKIDNCYNKGDITGAGAYVGGIAGFFRVYPGSGVGVLSNCMNAGKVSYTGTLTTTKHGTGGIIGSGNGSTGVYTFTNCYNCGSVTSGSNH